MNYLLLAYVTASIVMSIFTFALYGWDKHCARVNRWRVSEIRLHLCALLCGWPGALIGRAVFRHKTQKTGFTVITWAIVLLHVGLALALIYSQTPF